MFNFLATRWVPGACVLLAALGLAASGAANAAVIDVSSASSRLAVGQDFSVNFSISGLTPAPDVSLSAFDLDIRFDPAAMRLTGFGYAATPGGQNQLDLVESGSFPFLGGTLVNGDVIDAFGLSGNSAAVLDAGQSDTFTFLMLHFTATATSALSTVEIDLNDTAQLFVNSQAEKLDTTFGASAVHFAITGPMPPVPEPGALSMFAIGMVFLLAMRRRMFGNAVRFRPIAATAVALIMSGAPAAAQSPAPAVKGQPFTAKPSVAPAAARALTGVIVAIEGQRLMLALPGGGTRWVTVRVQLGRQQIGKKVSGIAVPSGDTDELRDLTLAD